MRDRKTPPLHASTRTTTRLACQPWHRPLPLSRHFVCTFTHRPHPTPVTRGDRTSPGQIVAAGPCKEVVMADRSSVLVAVFDDRLAAENAVRDLEAAEFHDDSIGFAIRGSEVVHGGMITDATGTKDAKGAVTGALTGGVVGGVLAAAAALMIPRAGPLVPGRVLPSLFRGAAAGTAVGRTHGAQTGRVASDDAAQSDERYFDEGKAIVAVKPGARAAEAGEILRRHGGYDLHNRRESPVDTTGTFSQP